MVDLSIVFSKFTRGYHWINYNYDWQTNMAMERSTIFNGKIHYKYLFLWPFSIAFCMFTRGYLHWPLKARLESLPQTPSTAAANSEDANTDGFWIVMAGHHLNV